MILIIRSTRSTTPASSVSATGVDDRSFYGHYGILNSEARIASYLGIVRRQLPPEPVTNQLYRTLPDSFGPQEQKPNGQTREYLGVKVYEGSYSYRGMRIVPSWGGSMFECSWSLSSFPKVTGPREAGG